MTWFDIVLAIEVTVASALATFFWSRARTWKRRYQTQNQAIKMMYRHAAAISMPTLSPSHLSYLRDKDWPDELEN